MHLGLLSMVLLPWNGRLGSPKQFTCSAARESQTWPRADSSVSQASHKALYFVLLRSEIECITFAVVFRSGYNLGK